MGRRGTALFYTRFLISVEKCLLVPNYLGKNHQWQVLKLVGENMSNRYLHSFIVYPQEILINYSGKWNILKMYRPSILPKWSQLVSLVVGCSNITCLRRLWCSEKSTSFLWCSPRNHGYNHEEAADKPNWKTVYEIKGLHSSQVSRSRNTKVDQPYLDQRKPRIRDTKRRISSWTRKKKKVCVL